MSCTRKNNFYLEYSTFIWQRRDSLQLSIKSNHNYIVFISLLCNWFRTLQKDSKLEQILTWLLQFFSPGSFLIFTLIFQASFWFSFVLMGYWNYFGFSSAIRDVHQRQRKNLSQPDKSLHQLHILFMVFWSFQGQLRYRRKRVLPDALD